MSTPLSQEIGHWRDIENPYKQDCETLKINFQKQEEEEEGFSHQKQLYSNAVREVKLEISELQRNNKEENYNLRNILNDKNQSCLIHLQELELARVIWIRDFQTWYDWRFF